MINSDAVYFSVCRSKEVMSNFSFDAQCILLTLRSYSPTLLQWTINMFMHLRIMRDALLKNSHVNVSLSSQNYSYDN